MIFLREKDWKAEIRDIIVVVIGITIFVSIFKFIGTNNIVEAFNALDKKYILAYAFVELLVIALWNYKSVFVINEVAKIKFRDVLPIHLTGLLINNLTPGPSVGGEPVKAYYLSKRIKRSISECLSILAVDSSSYVIAFALFAYFAAGYTILFIDVPILVGVVAVLAVLSIIGWGCAIHFALQKKSEEMKRLEHIEKWIYRLRVFSSLKKKFKTLRKFEDFMERQYEKFISTFGYIVRSKKKIVFILILSLVVEILHVGKLWILFQGIAPAPFLHILITSTIAMLLGYFVFIPGGTGVVEASMIAMFIALGIDPASAAVVTLISRAFFYLITYVLGYVSLLTLTLKHGSHKGKVNR